MQNLRDYWPQVLFCFGVIATLAVAIYRLKMAEDHIKDHCKNLDSIVKEFQTHLTTDGLHNTNADRRAQEEYRADVRDTLWRLEQGQLELMKEILKQK